MPASVLTAAAMREADRLTMESYGLTGFTLMESAGRAAAACIQRAFGPVQNQSVLILCGKGNNGGDGLVVGRVLHSLGARVQLITLATPDTTTPDTKVNLHLIDQLIAASDDNRLLLTLYESIDQLEHPGSHDLIVDALLGTGISRALRSPVQEIVAWINHQAVPTVAIDVPTGLDSDLGRVYGEAVRATCTVTMAAPKVGLFINDGPRYAGRVETMEIGIPAFILDQVAQQPGCAWLPSDDDVRAWLPVRAHDAHKYSAGFVLLAAGSAGLTGAPTLAARSAARSGAGAVVCACPAGLQPVLAQKLTTVMTMGLPETDDGFVAADAVAPLMERARKADALLIGCGLGRHPDTQQFVRDVLRQVELPVVLDADGLNALNGDLSIVTERSNGQWILTPHWGEFTRLTERDDLDTHDRIGLAARYAQAWNCVLILKGMPSVTGCPDGRVFINATGNAALATAGTGDVLAGSCAGFRAQGLSAVHAAVCALHVGGAVADAYATQAAPQSMLATDLIDRLPTLLHERFSR